MPDPNDLPPTHQEDRLFDEVQSLRLTLTAAVLALGRPVRITKAARAAAVNAVLKVEYPDGDVLLTVTQR